MIARIKVYMAASIVAASMTIALYLVFAGIGCFVSWSGDYWGVAAWDEHFRAMFVLLWSVQMVFIGVAAERVVDQRAPAITEEVGL